MINASASTTSMTRATRSRALSITPFPLSDFYSANDFDCFSSLRSTSQTLCGRPVDQTLGHGGQGNDTIVARQAPAHRDNPALQFRCVGDLGDLPLSLRAVTGVHRPQQP